MAKIIVVGDGPGGLSAALFLAKNGQEVTVYGQDKTAMNYALLYNYLGLPEINGTEFQAIAKSQVTAQGGTIVDAEVTAVTATADGYDVTLEDGSAEHADYLVMNEGRNPALATSLGVAIDDEGAIAVDRHGLSSVASVYVVGRSVRPARSQAIITAGAGAAAALDILSREAGEDVQDWDSPPKE